MSTSKQSVTLESLPPEVLGHICCHILDSKATLCLTVSRRISDNNFRTFQQNHSAVVECLENLTSLMLSGPLLKAHAENWLARKRRPYARSENFVYLPEVVGPENVKFIKSLDLQMSFNQKISHEHEWPSLLNMLVNDLPNLTDLKLSSSWETGRPAYPYHESGDPYESLSREEQERRTILRLGAFLTLRHPNLNRMIWPADSGPSFEADETRSTVYLLLDHGMYKTPGDLKREWKSVSKWTDETRTKKVASEDMVLNTTAIRRHRYSDLAHVPLSQFTIQPSIGKFKDNIISSEVLEETGCFRLVDDGGYILSSHTSNHNGSNVSVDEWIDLCTEVGRKLSNTDALADMIARERVARQDIENDLRVAYAENDQLVEKLEDSDEYRRSSADGTERLLDQLYEVKDAEEKARERCIELESEIIELKANLKKTQAGTEGILPIFQWVKRTFWLNIGNNLKT